MAAKSVAYSTFGCRLNQYDTETLRDLLERDGRWRTAAAGDEPELVVINTCSVTARADATARKAIRRAHAEHPRARIVVTGCYAQRAPAELAALPGVALVLGAADRADVARHVGALAGGGATVAVSPIEAADTFLDVPITEMMERSRAVVKVQEGCNNECTFCIVPQTRGASRSRPFASVVEQVRELVAAGYVEIVLTGVHLGDYGLDLEGARRDLVDLVGAVLAVDGLGRLRLSSIEPASIDHRLIALMAADERFARHFHIPLQSGSDRVLERMGRRYRAADFEALVRRIAAEVPGCGIGVDVICGFPGEGDDDFRRTFDLVASLPVSYVHAFTYSTRPGSVAEGFGDQVPGEVRKRRTRAMKRLGREHNRMFREAHLGRVVEVLAEGDGGDGCGGASGWTDNYLRVDAPGVDATAGALTRVRVSALGADGLIGEAP